jgi:hypothetical protein
VKRRETDAGAVSAEVAIATPAMLLMLLGAVQFAVWLHAVHIAQTCADRGLTASRVYGGTIAAGRSQAQTLLAQLGGEVLVDPQVNVAPAAGAGGQAQVRVEVDAGTISVVPLVHLPVHVVAQGPAEIWTVP